MRKKLFALLAALVFAVLLAMPAGAETAGERFTVPDTTFSFVVPEGASFIHPDLPASDPAWAAANILDITDKQTEMLKDSVAGEIHLPNGRIIGVTTKRSSNFSEIVYNLREADEEMRGQIRDRLTPSGEMENSGGTFSWVDHPQTPFFCLDLFSPLNAFGTEEEMEIVYERLYGTIVNGSLIAFDLFPTQDRVSDELDAVLRELVASSEVSEFLPMPSSEMTTQTLVVVCIVLAVLLFLIGTLIYWLFARKKEKRDKAELGNRLIEYRRSKEGHEEQGDGALRFQNMSECSDDAIKAFSKFHAFRHGMVMPIFTIALAVVSIVLLYCIGSDDSWWMSILLIAIAVYFTYRVCYAPTAMSKTLIRVNSKFKNRNVTFYFYEGDFRITGMQSSSLHPYFQITQFVENGDYFYLYLGIDNAYYIRKDAFSLGEADAFRAFMKDKLGKKAKVRGGAGRSAGA